MEGPTLDSVVLVTGGTGTLGRSVVADLAGRGVPARVLTRSATAAVAGAQRAVGDLGTGAGLEAAVDGIRAVVHCASDPRHGRSVDVEGTGRLVAALAGGAPDAHLVYVSIVGCDRNPVGYYRTKVRTEEVVARAPASSIVRATQFHDLVARFARGLARGPFGVAPRGLGFQSCATGFLAAHLVDTALSAPLADRLELAGPERIGLAEAIIATAAHDGRRQPRVLPIPAVGKVLRSFAAGSNLPGPAAVTGGPSYRQWLDQTGVSRAAG